MSPTFAVLVNGISATGKTTVAKRISAAFALPLFAKDAVKERLFDTLGYSDRDWAHKLSGASHAVLNYVMEEEIRAGRSFVIEANFNPRHDVEKFRKWQDRYGLKIAQVLCYASGEVVFERFCRRLEHGERHPGHADHLNVEAFRGYLMQGRCEPLAVDGPVVEVDTTKFDQVDFDALLRRISEVTGMEPSFVSGTTGVSESSPIAEG